MDQTEAFRKISTLLPALAARYTHSRKLAPLFDEALKGINARDVATTDKALRALFKSKWRLADADREEVRWCLQLLNYYSKVDESDATRQARRSDAGRKKPPPGFFQRQEVQLVGLALLGAALLTTGLMMNQARPIFLGSVALAGAVIFLVMKLLDDG